MVRSFFFAVGIYVVTCGLTCLIVDKVTFHPRVAARESSGNQQLLVSATQYRSVEFQPPAWLSFSLMTLGTVTTLYAIALPAPSPIRDVL